MIPQNVILALCNAHTLTLVLIKTPMTTKLIQLGPLEPSSAILGKILA